jgi:hypothetical protein
MTVRFPPAVSSSVLPCLSFDKLLDVDIARENNAGCWSLIIRLVNAIATRARARARKSRTQRTPLE